MKLLAQDLWRNYCDAQAPPPINADHFPTFVLGHCADLHCALSIDAGYMEGEDASFTVIQAWAFNENNLYFLNQFREQCEFDELKRMAKRFIRRYRPDVVLIEKTANGPALISELKRKAKTRYLVLPITHGHRSRSTPRRSGQRGALVEPIGHLREGVDLVGMVSTMEILNFSYKFGVEKSVLGESDSTISNLVNMAIEACSFGAASFHFDEWSIRCVIAATVTAPYAHSPLSGLSGRRFPLIESGKL